MAGNLRKMARRSAPLTPADISAGGLSVEQQATFYQLAALKTTPFFRQILASAMTVDADNGKIPRMGFSRRVLRKKEAAIDSGATTKPTLSDVSYNVSLFSVGLDLDQRLRRKTVAKERFRQMVITGFAKQCGTDLEDLFWNGDTTTDPGDDDYDFLSLNNGVVALTESGGVTVDGSTINGGDISEEHFFELAEQLNGKYIQLESDGTVNTERTNYKFIVSWATSVKWQRYIAKRMDGLGADAFRKMLGDSSAPMGIPIKVAPAFPEGKILLASADYIQAVRTEDMAILSTVEGRTAIRTRTEAFALHGDIDFLLMEDEAFVIATGLN